MLLIVGGLVTVAEPALALTVQVTGATPGSLGQGATDVVVSVTGSGFSDLGGDVNVTVSGTGVTVSETVLVDSTHLDATVSVAEGATLGARNVTVSQGIGGLDSGTCTGCLTIVAGPTVASISPTAATNTGSVSVVVLGTGFHEGAQVSLVREGITGLEATGEVVSNGGTRIDATFDLTGQAPVRHIVVVTNPDDHGVGTLGNGITGGFVVSAGTPTVTDVAPDAGGQGATGLELTLTGTNFARDADISFSGTGVTVTSATWQSPTSYAVTIDVASAATASLRDVTVTNADTQAGTCSGCFTVTAKPTVTSATPDDVGAGAVDHAVVLAGSGFVATPTVQFSGTGITVDEVVRDSAAQLTIHITIASDAPAGPRNITAINPDGGTSDACIGCFTVNAPPSLSAVTPSSRGQGAADQDLTLTGTNFAGTNGDPFPGTVDFGAGITVNSAVRDSSTQLTVNVTVGAPVGPRDVVVVNPDAGTATCEGCFTVNAAPTISTVVPSSGGQSASNRVLTITGTNFAGPNGAFGGTVAFSGTGVTVNSVTKVSATQLTVDITIAAGADATARDVTVTNPDAGFATCVGCFTVNVGPDLTSVTPSSGGQGATDLALVFAGSNFTPTPTVAFSGTGITVVSVTRDLSTQLTVVVSIASNATASARDVTVTNPDGGVDTLNAGFTVTGGPTIDSITPSAGANSGSVTITNLAGTNFVDGATVTLERDGHTAITMTGTTVDNDGTTITGSFNLAPGGVPAAPGPWDVRVTNPDAGSAVLAGGFTVTGGAPTVTSVDPAARPQGSSAQTIELTGTNFATGAQVSFSGTGITVGTPTVVSSTHIDVVISITGGAPLGARNVTVTNTDSQSGTCTGCFTVTAAPTIQTVSPNTRAVGLANQTINVTGTGFVDGAVATFSGTKVSVNSTTFNSSTSLTLNVSIAADAATGPRDLTVTNPDTGAATCSGCFTVNALPTLSAVSPPSRPQGASNVTLTLTGTEFRTGATVGFSGTGITVNSVVVTNATTLTVTVTIASSAPATARDVTVTNTDGGSATATGAFTVNALPTVDSVTPSTRPRGVSTTVVIGGTGFQATPTVQLGAGITVTNVQRDSASQLTVSITTSSTASNLFRSVAVTNPDGGVGTKEAAFRLPGASPIVFRNGTWFLRSSLTTGASEVTFGYGNPSDQPVMGDWNGDGVRTPGVFRGGQWFLINGFGSGATTVVSYGAPGDIPIVGHWGGAGPDTLGVYRPSTGTFFLRNSNTSGVADITVSFGNPNEVPVVGDWDGDGTTTVGLFRSGTWLLRNANTSGIATVTAGFGQSGDRPVVGDWNGDGSETFGITRNGSWFVRNSVTTGVADIVFGFGDPGDVARSWR